MVAEFNLYSRKSDGISTLYMTSDIRYVSLCFLLNLDGLDLMTHLFQGQLVLRTRCLECESFTERREDFQDISVPVLDDTPSSPDDLSEGEDFYSNALCQKNNPSLYCDSFKACVVV